MLYWTTVCEQQFTLASCCKIMYAHVTVRNIQLRLIKEFHLYFSNKMFLVSKDKDLRQQCPSSHSIRVTFGSLRFIHSYSTHIFSKKKKPMPFEPLVWRRLYLSKGQAPYVRLFFYFHLIRSWNISQLRLTLRNILFSRLILASKSNAVLYYSYRGRKLKYFSK